MPRRYKKRTKKNYRKRYTKKTPMYTQMTVHNTNKRFPLGKTFKTVLPYFYELDSLNPGVGTAASHVYSCNGVYDPDITGVGHQPLGFDQFSLLYDHYTVIGSKISVTFVNKDTTLTQMVGIRISDTASTDNNFARTVENGTMTWAVLGADGKGDNKVTLSKAVSIKKFMGRPNILSEDELRGTIISNPLDQCYFHIMAGETGLSDPSTVKIIVKIEYVTVFTEPKVLAQS